MRPSVRLSTATPGTFCDDCTASGRVGRLAHRVIYKNGKPYGLCGDCYKARQEHPALKPDPPPETSPERARQIEALEEDVEAIEDEERDEPAERRPAVKRWWSRRSKVVDVDAFRRDYENGIPWRNLIQKYGSRTKLYQVLRQNQIAKRPDRFRPPATERQRQVGRDTAMRRKIQIDEAALIRDYKAGTPVKELSQRYGVFTSGIYARLKKAGVNGTRRRPAETARLPRAAQPSSRALSLADPERRRKRQASLSVTPPATPADGHAVENGERPAARIKFRVVECELAADDRTLAEGLRALTTALTQK